MQNLELYLTSAKVGVMTLERFSEETGISIRKVITLWEQGKLPMASRARGMRLINILEFNRRCVSGQPLDL
ncbi:hypothetical protein ACFQ02_03765 [Seminibacterium arietis]|uniref:Helix-turn-helix domain-containing protein n=1 Tax=Seminibacterium arietis TaxID=1173502 RepID=A0ABW3I7X3_9PAST